MEQSRGTCLHPSGSDRPPAAVATFGTPAHPMEPGHLGLTIAGSVVFPCLMFGHVWSLWHEVMVSYHFPFTSAAFVAHFSADHIAKILGIAPGEECMVHGSCRGC